MIPNEAVSVEQSLLDMCALVASLTGGRELRPRFAAVYRPGFPFPSFYGRVALHDVAEEDAQEAMRVVREADLMLVSYTQGGVPESMGALLREAGYAPMVTQTGMLLELAGHGFAESPQVVRVGRGRIAEWGEVSARAFNKPSEQPAFDAMVRRDDCYFYGYEEDGRLIGTTLLYTADGNAGIHEVGVLPECRRRSVAGRLMRHALTQAKRDGAKISTLQASALGEPLYRALGFRAVSRLDTWIKPPQG